MLRMKHVQMEMTVYNIREFNSIVNTMLLKIHASNKYSSTK